jgi:hypothetical protein
MADTLSADAATHASRGTARAATDRTSMARRKLRDPITTLPDGPTALETAHDPHALGPSDSSDSGSDLMGLAPATDRNGTGERASVDEPESDELDGDILPDRVVDADHAGLGGGLDQAEEAQFGVTDEQLMERLHRNPW